MNFDLARVEERIADHQPYYRQSERKKGSTKEACLWTYRALDGPVISMSTIAEICRMLGIN